MCRIHTNLQMLPKDGSLPPESFARKIIDKGFSKICWYSRYWCLYSVQLRSGKHPASIFWVFILSILMDPMQISSLHNEALLIQAKFKTKTKTSILAKMTLAATVWHIWKERNMRIFQLQQSNKIMCLEDYMRTLVCFWRLATGKWIEIKQWRPSFLIGMHKVLYQ